MNNPADKTPDQLASTGSDLSDSGRSLALESGRKTVDTLVDVSGPRRTRRNREVLLKSGDVVGGRYEIVSVLGEGGMGVVYKAVCPPFGIAAIKLMDKPSARFESEVLTGSKVNHPNIVQTYDVGVEEHGKPYLVMDYVRGDTLANVLHREGALPLSRFLHIFLQLCDALEHFHKLKIVHRDLKPSNVILTSRFLQPDIVKVVDFGIAKVLTEDVMNLSQEDGELLGTPYYMSPEQISGNVAVDYRADIYALGAMMYEAISGVIPFAGGTTLETLCLKIGEDVPALPSNVKAPSILVDLISVTMARDPNERLQTVNEVRAVLESIRKAGNDRKLLALGAVCAVVASFLVASGVKHYLEVQTENGKLSSADAALAIGNAADAEHLYKDELDNTANNVLMNEQRIRALDGLASIHINRKEFERAYDLLQEALGLMARTGIPVTTKAGIESHMGLICYSTGRWTAAGEWFKQAEETYESVPNFEKDPEYLRCLENHSTLLHKQQGTSVLYLPLDNRIRSLGGEVPEDTSKPQPVPSGVVDSDSDVIPVNPELPYAKPKVEPKAEVHPPKTEPR